MVNSLLLSASARVALLRSVRPAQLAKGLASFASAQSPDTPLRHASSSEHAFVGDRLDQGQLE